MKLPNPPFRKLAIAAAIILSVLASASLVKSILKSDEQRLAELQKAHQEINQQGEAK